MIKVLDECRYKNGLYENKDILTAFFNCGIYNDYIYSKLDWSLQYNKKIIYQTLINLLLTPSIYFVKSKQECIDDLLSDYAPRSIFHKIIKNDSLKIHRILIFLIETMNNTSFFKYESVEYDINFIYMN